MMSESARAGSTARARDGREYESIRIHPKDHRLAPDALVSATSASLNAAHSLPARNSAISAPSSFARAHALRFPSRSFRAHSASTRFNRSHLFTAWHRVGCVATTDAGCAVRPRSFESPK